jgi:hypothetical protein
MAELVHARRLTGDELSHLRLCGAGKCVLYAQWEVVMEQRVPLMVMNGRRQLTYYRCEMHMRKMFPEPKD